MKRKYITIFGILACMICSCKVDLLDVNTSERVSAQESEMTVDVQVSGEMIAARDGVTESELMIQDFDLFIFNVSAQGTILEYISMSNKSEPGQIVPGTKDKLIWSGKIVLPSSGTKRIVAVGNSIKALYPDMTLGKTSYEDFCQSFHFNATDGKNISFPLVMTGSTLLASSDKAHVFVKLARQYNRFEVESEVSSIKINSFQIVSTPSSAYPFFDIYESENIPTFIKYPETPANKPTYILYTPGGAPELMVHIKVNGEMDGTSFTKTFECSSPLYPDYSSKMILGETEGEISARFTPNYDSFQTEGGAMTYTYASWMWTGMYASNDYAQAWVAGNPVTSPEGATFRVVDVENPEYSVPVTFSTGTAGQLKNRLRAHSMYTGDYFIWTVQIPEAKKDGTLSMKNAMVSATQWGPKYFVMEYSWDGSEWHPVSQIRSEKTASGAGRTVNYNIKLSKNDTPESLDYSITVEQSLKNATLYTRLIVADACCSKEANGDIDPTKTAGITYVHVQNYDLADKDRTFDDDWAIITFTYQDPQKK